MKFYKTEIDWGFFCKTINLRSNLKMKLLLSSLLSLSFLSWQASALNIIVVTDNETSAESLTTFLSNEGHTLTIGRFNTGIPDAETIANNDLIIVARESNSGDYDDGTEPADWNGIPLPMINMAPHTMRPVRWGWSDGNGLDLLENIDGFDEYPDTSHPFLEGLTEPTTTIFTTPTAGMVISGSLAPEAITVASYSLDRQGIFIIPEGTAMFGTDRGSAGADRVGFIRGDESSWEFVNTNGQQILRNMIAIYDPNNGDDTDNDGLIDSFEQTIIDADPDDAISTLADVLPGDDFDLDDLTNEEEFAQDPRTNPINPDTDGDGINDGAEVDGSGNTFDGMPTTPTLADSDGDGINDMDEGAAANGFVTDPNNDDTDGDTLPDGYELVNILDPTADDSGLDADSDLSTNLNEFNIGTDPQNPDTDEDGYLDGVESDDGSFDDITTDTGTDPLNPDTDGDGIEDGAETATGNFTNADDTGTSPLNEDSDGDNFRDGAEINLHGTNPNLATSVPNTELSVFFVGGTPEISALDRPIVTFLEDKYGLGNITYTEDSASATGDEDGADLVVISSTVLSRNVRGKFHNSTVPVVHWEQSINPNSNGDFGLAGDSVPGNSETTTIDLLEHPITANLTSPLTLWATGESNLFHTTSIGEGVTAIATGTDGPATGSPLFMVADTGDALLSGAGVTGDIAPARRAYLPFDDNSFSVLSDEGYQLVGNVLDWTVGRLGGAAALVITNIIYDAETAPGDVSISLTFNSVPNRSYAFFATDDLSLPLIDRTNIDSGFPGEAGSSTFTFSLSDHGFNPATPRLFFFVVEE